MRIDPLKISADQVCKITGYSVRHSRRLIRITLNKLGKPDGILTVEEFCTEKGLNIEKTMAFLSKPLNLIKL